MTVPQLVYNIAKRWRRRTPPILQLETVTRCELEVDTRNARANRKQPFSAMSNMQQPPKTDARNLFHFRSPINPRSRQSETANTSHDHLKAHYFH